MWWTGQMSQKYILPICQTLSPRPPWRACALQRKFGERAWNAFTPPVAALLLVLTKRSAAPGHRMAEEILRMPKVIADIAQLGGNVIMTPVLWVLNVNAWHANCLLAINAQYLKKTRTLRNRKLVKASHTARLVTGTEREPHRVCCFLKRRVSAFRRQFIAVTSRASSE